MGVATALAAGPHWCCAGQFLFMGGCYDARAAPRGGVCGEARGGACVRYGEGMRSVETTGTCTTSPEKCNPDACNVQIGDSIYCSQCSNGGSDASSPAPTNGVCSADNNECSVKADGRCTTCDHESFMFKGGCYTTAKAPGSTMCTQAANWICTSVAAGNNYFIPPNADASHDSVVACNDTTEITLTNKKKYVGVANCLTCTQPADGNADTPTAAKCTACEDGYFVASAACTACDEQCATCEGTNSDSKCKSCKVGYFLGATTGAAGKCIQCDNLEDPSWKGVANCAKCTSSNTQNTPATCTQCAASYYLKTVESTTSCVSAADCNNGFFPTTDSSNKKVCVKCSATDNGGIENCSTCTPIESPTTTVLVKCSACDNSKKVGPGGSSCVTACPENSSDQSGACICSSGFAPSDNSCGASSSSNLSTGAIVEYL